MTEEGDQEKESMPNEGLLVDELPPPTKVDLFNAKVLIAEQFAYSIGMVVATIASWGFLIYCMWSWFLVPAVYVQPLDFGHACGFALFLLALNKMGRARPEWIRRPSWLNCNETVRRGLIVEDIKNSVMRPLFYTIGGAIIHLISRG